MAFLLAAESELDRRAVARYADALADMRRSRPGFTVAAVRDDLTRRLLMRAWRCPEQDLDAEASSRGLVCVAHATAAAKRFVPGFLREMREMTDQTEAAGAAR